MATVEEGNSVSHAGGSRGAKDLAMRFLACSRYRN